jgi:DNA-binding NarL/FixJ family response regulator
MKILVIDDHPLIQEALKHVLNELDAALNLRQAPDAATARLALAAHPDIDLIVLDLTLPGTDGFTLLIELRRGWPGIPVLVLSATHDQATVETALDLGAMGFIPKTANPRVLVDALRLVLSGGIYVPTLGAAGIPVSPRPVTHPDSLGLTMRQGDVLQLLVQGKRHSARTQCAYAHPGGD